MTDTIDFDVDLNSEWTAEDSLALDAEILARYGRLTASEKYDKWESKTLRIAVQICANRGMTWRYIAEHLKLSSRQVERITSSPPETLTWVPPRPIPIPKPKLPTVRPCNACGVMTRPKRATEDEYPGTKCRNARELCSTCYPKIYYPNRGSA